MKVKNMLALAKQGDEYGFKCLKEHYEPILKEYITKNYGKDTAEGFMELMPNFIVYYFKNKFKYRLDDFLKQKADTLYQEKKPKTIIGKSVDKKDTEKINLIIQHYGSSFYNKLLKHKGVLNEEELKKFSYEFVKKGIFKLKSNNCDVRNYMINFITNELKRYDKESETLLKRYILIVGINEKILDYYIKKYRYLLNEYESNRMYSCLCSNYEKLVSESLHFYNKIDLNIEKLIIKNLIKKFNVQRKKEEEILKNKSNTSESFKCLYDNYSYIKNNIFNKFNGKLNCDSKTLKEEIDKKYKDFITAYLEGKSNNYVQRYLNTRLTDYFNNLEKQSKKNNTINIDLMDKEKLIYSNKDLINKSMKKSIAFIPDQELRKKVGSYYQDSYDEYMKKERKTNFRRYTYTRLNKYINKINDMYGISYIDDMASNIKESVGTSNTISDDILDQIFDSWVSYYINSDIHKKVSFEEFMITALLKYNETDYRKIIDIKNHISCKVLRR